MRRREACFNEHGSDDHEASMTFDIATARQTNDKTVIHCHEDDLSAARGVFTGVLIGAVFWLVLIVSISIGFAHAGPHAALQTPAATTYDASEQARSLAVPRGVRGSDSKEA
jgi:hypothetical protein